VDRIGPQKRNLLLGGLLLLSFLLYANAVMNGFTYDDHSQIERNPYVHSFKYLGKIFGSSLIAQQGKQAAPNFYRPVVNFSFLLCYKLFGASPYGFHLISILLHCVVVWLVFVVSAELLSSEWLGLIAAAIFALHPIHTEPVVWIDGISDVYVSIFCLLAFWIFLRQSQERSLLWTRVGMLGSFVLALFSKETAMTFPVLVTAYEHFYRPDRLTTSWRQKLSRYGWFWVALFAYLGVRAASIGRLVPARVHTDISLREMSVSALALIGQYAEKLVWPVPLVAFSVFKKSESLGDPYVLLGLVVVAVASAAFVLLWNRARLYTFGLFWIFLTIAPALNARWMATTVFAERYLYLPSVAFSWLVAGAVWWCWNWRAPQAGARGLRWALAGGSVILALLAGREIITRNRDWKSDSELILSTLAVRPDSPYAHNDLGQMEWYQGDHAEAERQWQLALSYKPDTAEALANLGFARLEEKRYDEAIPYLKRAIQLKPLFSTPHIHLARVYAAEGRNPEAEAEFHRAVEINPMNTDARKALGKFYLDAGRLPEAEEQFQITLDAAPDLEAWGSLGKIYEREGASEKAENAWRQVLSLEPFDVKAHLSLGRIYLAKGQLADAKRELQACLLMDPANPEALAALQRVSTSTRSLQPAH
jgi:tetratricopeptide (TPR) repeat protein